MSRGFGRFELSECCVGGGVSDDGECWLEELRQVLVLPGDVGNEAAGGHGVKGGTEPADIGGGEAQFVWVEGFEGGSGQEFDADVGEGGERNGFENGSV